MDGGWGITYTYVGYSSILITFSFPGICFLGNVNALNSLRSN